MKSNLRRFKCKLLKIKLKIERRGANNTLKKEQATSKRLISEGNF